MLESLTQRIKYKIKTPEEIRNLIGPMPRQQKVIMCHGVFDLVHPGHVRHLLYAKSRAPILIASITADRHVTKGMHRPHVPEDLRAVNLAAFEMIDYVLIDPNATPIENLKIIQPDYLAKGYEYAANGLPPATTEEAEMVRAYGGDILFTPGDIVYSSTQLLKVTAPSLKLEKLQIVMGRNGVTFDDLHRTLDQLGMHSIHVVGDTIVDSYTHCAMIGGQTKTPTMSVLFERKADFIGGAAIVAKHCRAAGAEVTFTTVLGDDDYRNFVVDGLTKSGIKVNAMTDGSRPTVNKNAIVAAGYRLLKIDTLDNSSIPDTVLAAMTQSVREIQTDAVIYSDFRHGIFNRRTIPAFVHAIPERVYRVADSQVASRWGNITDFQRFDLITPNEREARFALGDQDSGIRPLACDLYDVAQCKLLILKLSERGVLTCSGKDRESLHAFFVVDSFVENLVDPVGAGDALLAYATLAMLASRNETQATILGTMAAACGCEVEGNFPITPDQVHARLDTVERQMNYE
jgi:rfaE bifunctional protein kinase chain/domain